MVYIGNVREMPVGKARNFSYPSGRSRRRPALLIRLEDGFVAYDGLCTHMQARVEWDQDTGKIRCKAHNGTFDPKAGERLAGPPKESLKKLDFKIEENGDIYVIV